MRSPSTSPSRSAAALPAGLALGFLADRLWGDPQRCHPVAAFGSVATRLEDRWYGDSRVAGIAYVVTLVAVPTLAAGGVERATTGRPVLRAATIAVATWAVLGGRSLERAAQAVAQPLERGDLDGARAGLPSLVSRDPQNLDAAGVARATVESVAENTSDAVTAPLFWGALAGLPGLVAYRASNTLDAMVGYRSERYERFGWAAARLDDAVNLAPARLAGALALAAAPWVGGSASAGWVAMRRDAPAHPSPNGGVVEAAFAGVLGVSLGGVNAYGGVREDRGRLGDGPPPGPEDVARANRLSRLVGLGSLAVACAMSCAMSCAVSGATPRAVSWVGARLRRSWRR